MRKILGIVLKSLLVLVVASWIILVIVEFNRYKSDQPMLIELKEDKLTYDDGVVYVHYGLGYKSIKYERTAIEGKEFGNIFKRVRTELPK